MDEIDELRLTVDDGLPGAAGQAAVRLVKLLAGTRVGELAGEAPRLLALAARPGVDRTHVVIATSGASFGLALGALHVAMDQRTEPAPGLVAVIAALAEAGFAAMPEHLPARNTLALARLMQNRPAEVRELYLAQFAPTLDPRAGAIGQAIRAAAEVDLGDLDQAVRLVDAAQQVAGTHLLVRVARAMVQRAQLRRD